MYKPYKKENDTPLYVDIQSNHPPSILQNIPKSVNLRLSSISSNQDVFREACGDYQLALQKSGHTHELKHSPKEPQNARKNSRRSRRVTYFNPPYSKNVQTNLGQKFLQLIDECFPPTHPLSKVVTRNNVKVSYKCMPNMMKVISSHNKKVLKPVEEVENNNPGCNCRPGGDPCPMDGGCLVDKLVYRASVTDENNTVETYTGLTSMTFKRRHYGHKRSFRRRECESSTTLSGHIWKLKDRNLNYNVKWSVVDRAGIFNPTSRKCRLCLIEKYFILFQPEGATLNKRSELFSTCRHRLRQLLRNT